MPALIKSWLPFWHFDVMPSDDAAPQIDEELMFHFRSLVEENLSRGLSSDEAWADAQRRFGSLDHYANQTWRVDMAHQLTVQRIVIFGLLALTLLCGWLWLQVHSLNGQNSQLLQLVQTAAAQEKSQPDMTGYPIKFPFSEMRSIDKLSVDFGKLKLQGDDITAIPVRCERGVTGIVLMGKGSFQYNPDPEKKFEGHFQSVLLRFNPKDIDKILKLSDGKQSTDKATYEIARGLLPHAVNHSWQSNGDAIIPPEGTFSAVLLSPEYGDLLVSAGPGESMVYNFSDRKTLYEQKK